MSSNSGSDKPRRVEGPDAEAMRLEIKVGPARLTVHRGYTFMVTDPDAQIPVDGNLGLFFYDTRLINIWLMYADGARWRLLSGGSLTASAARVYFTNPPITTANGLLPENTIGLMLGRRIDAGMHEDFVITNYGAERACFNLEFAIRSDFADLFEVKSCKVTRRGAISTEWSQEGQSLTTRYSNADFSRALRITASGVNSPMTTGNGRLSFLVDLLPGATWRGSLLYDFADGDDWRLAPRRSVIEYLDSESVHSQQVWQESVTKVSTSNETFSKTFAQAIDDMSALRLPIEGTSRTQFIPAAGLPWFAALFGRDALVISLQTAIVHPEFALGALYVLARYQAREKDDYRDAEPGKILHEFRRGELAHFKLIPHTPYFGAADTTPLFLITLHSAWMCTGDRNELVKRMAAAERCLEWIDLYGDRDHDGFQEYQTRSSAGYENQGWKDSGDAIMYEDGALVRGPKALCELQGYVYDAWLRMAHIYDALGRPERAGELRAKAAKLYDAFNAAFWNEEAGCYALCLDADKQPVLSVASNQGHCLWAGIVPPDRARRVADRLMQPDMWSGWGIRTLSSKHKSFNPFNYQTGSVWPHDNGFIAKGFKRYDFHAETNHVAEAITRAARYFALYQLPELYGGTQWDGSNFPIQYLGANVPQGWAAGSLFSVLQAMLGFQPDAPNGKLYLDPVLPEWMPDLTIRDLRVGKHRFDIRFAHADGMTQWDVLDGDAKAITRRPMSEWSRALHGK